MRQTHKAAALVGITAIAALAFIAWLSHQPTAAVPKAERRQARAERLEEQLARPIRSRTWRVGEHELVLVEAPASNGADVVLKQCFVWRDASFKVSSMQCTMVEVDVPE